MRAKMADILEIKYYGCNILTQKTAMVDAVTPEIRQLINNMIATMYDADGVGLAAPQVGVPLSIFVCDPLFAKDGERHPIVFINPLFIEYTGETIFEEGCLSFPNVFEQVKRFEEVKLRYRDIDFVERFYEASGKTAIILQHETDHLNGIILTDKMNPIRKMAHAFKLNRIFDKSKKMSNEMKVIKQNA